MKSMVESIAPVLRDATSPIEIMRWVIARTTPHYSCLRPPGAAGAALFPNSQANLLDLQHLVAIGVVEPPYGRTCKELGECEMEDGHCARAIHAEVNAILALGRAGYTAKDGIMYSILLPCYQCTKVIAAAGVSIIYYAAAAYDEERTANLCKLAGITRIRLEGLISYGQ